MMSSFRSRTLFASLAVVAFHALHAAAADDFGSAEPFKAGDTVCYVGDSITHGGWYHAMIDLFYATRFPDRPLQTWNCGFGGDRAAGIMGDEKFRLNQDILGHHPTVATIMLGMNDIGHSDYGPDKTGPEVEQRRRASLETYDAKMKLLIEALEKSGSRVILITPSIYDETTKLATAKPDVGPGRRAALSECAHQMEAWSKEYHTGLVRVQETMNAITAREQANDPAFTLIGPDRVHPGSPGHFVMAYVFLRAQGMPQEVARIVVDAHTAQSIGANRCEINHIKASPGAVEFDCLEKSLPFVPPNDAKPALALVPFQQELNQESLKIAGLAEGRYTLAIDGQAVGEYPAAELAAGINLAENEKTPQYKQSAAATKLYVGRTDAARGVRAIAAYYYTISRSHTDVADRAAFEKKLVPLLEEAKAKNKKADADAAEALLGNPDELAKRQAQFQEATAALLKACQPVSHHFAITRR